MGKSGNPARRAEQEKPREYDPTPVDADGIEDFDAFWSEHDKGREGTPVRIRGEVVTLPPALPLQFELIASKQRTSTDPEDAMRLVALLFGKGAVKRWAKAGMDGEEFQILLAWATARVGGADVSMAEVADMVRSRVPGANPQ